MEWKNYSGLQKLQCNLKAEEYFDSLLKLMFAFKDEFAGLSIAKKTASDIERIFELWNSRNIARKKYEENCALYKIVFCASAKHFIVLPIIEYLERRYKYNPQYRNELVSWCEKDTELYGRFLVECHADQLFTADEQMKFMDAPDLKQKILASISLDNVRCLKDYTVPFLGSYDLLWFIYSQEHNDKKLAWLESIGKRIGYPNDEDGIQTEKIQQSSGGSDISNIINTIEVSRSGQEGKLAFLNSQREPCSTENAFKDYMEQRYWKVMRSEVAFWQAMFCLSFWEEIFDGMKNPALGRDIPQDLFLGYDFYFNRQRGIDRKYDSIKQQNLRLFINEQIEKYRNHWTRLLYNGNQNMIEYFETDIVQSYLETVDVNIFAKIVYRIAKNPNENRSGISDFTIWNDQDLKMVEVKKVREQVRGSQRSWIAWMLSENIPIEITRVKGI